MTEKVLVVAPAFHSYGASIGRGFNRLGYDANVYIYDALPTTAAKLHNKLRYELPSLLGLGDPHSARSQRMTQRAAQGVRATRPDVVVVVKGDLLGGEFVDAVRAVGGRTFLWLYDDVARMRTDLETVRLYDRVATYSAADQQRLAEVGLEALLVRVGFDDDLVIGGGPTEDAVTFVGARYPERTEILQALVARGVSVHAYGRDWSHRLSDRLRTWDLHRPAIPASGDLSLDDAASAMQRGIATLNIHARGQDGLNTRLFEACGAGALQLVDRPEVEDVYEVGREVLVFANVDDIVEAVARARREPTWSQKIREAARRRTLAEHTYAHRCAQLASAW